MDIETQAAIEEIQTTPGLEAAEVARRVTELLAVENQWAEGCITDEDRVTGYVLAVAGAF
jgi:hypothetical protein